MDNKISYKKFNIDITICDTDFTVSIFKPNSELLAQTTAKKGELKKIVEWARKHIDSYLENKNKLESELNGLKIDWANKPTDDEIPF